MPIRGGEYEEKSSERAVVNKLAMTVPKVHNILKSGCPAEPSSTTARRTWAMQEVS